MRRAARRRKERRALNAQRHRNLGGRDAERRRFRRGVRAKVGSAVAASALFLHHVVPDGVGRSVLEPGQLRAGCLECLVVVPAGPVLP